MNKAFQKVLDFQTRLQGLANTLGHRIVSNMSSTDTALLKMLQEELLKIRKWIISETKSPKFIFEALQNVRKNIIDIRKRGVEAALDDAKEQSRKLLELAASQAAEEIKLSLQQLRENEREIRRRTLKSELTDRQISDILDYKPFDGKTVGQWFDAYGQTDMAKIFQAVQRGITEGTSLHSIMRTIRGSEDESGVLGVSRDTARMLGRTVINGVANHGRLEMYRQNADVLDGVKWLATLDSRACPVCGVMDGKIWKPDDLTSVKVPPAHPNCRCVLIPYIDMGDDSQRPAEAENFDKLAEEAYEANPSTKKEWKDLSYDYRKQLRYEAIKQWEKEHPDQEAYRQVHGMTFTDYLKEQPPEFQREYLGATRYNYYKEGKLSLDMMVNPDRGFLRTIKELKGKTEPAFEKETSSLQRKKLLETKKEYENKIEEINKKLEGEIEPVNMAETFTQRKEWIDAQKEYEKKIEEINKKQYANPEDKIRAETDARIDRAQRAIDILFPVNGTVPTELTKAAKKLKNPDVEKTAAQMEQIIHSLGIKINRDAPNFIESEERSTYSRKRNTLVVYANKENYAVQNTNHETTAHELAHWIECNNSDINKKLRELYDKITIGEAIQIPDGYEGELYRKSIIPLPDEYTTRDYDVETEKRLMKLKKGVFGISDAEIADIMMTQKEQNGRSELLSTFFEYLFRKPDELMTKYPEYFNKIIGVLR